MLSRRIFKIFKEDKFLVGLSLFLILALNAYFILSTLLATDLLPGADSPFYLYYAEKLAEDGSPGTFAFRDRTLTVLEPAIISQVLGVSPLWGLRIFLVAVSILLLLGMFLVSWRILGEGLAILVVLITSFSFAFIRFFWDLYANVFALSIVPFIIYLLWRKPNLKEVFLAAILVGSLFLTHNLTSFGFTIAVFLPLLLTILLSRSESKSLRRSVLYLIFFGFTAFLTGSGFLIHFIPRFVSYLIDPIGSLDLLSYRGLANTGIYIPFEPVQFGDGVAGISPVIHTIVTFLQKKLFIPGTLGFLVAIYLWRKGNKDLLPVLFWFVGLAALSLQGFLGFNWAPERFTLMTFQPLSIFAGIFVLFVASFLRTQKFVKINKVAIFSFFGIFIIFLLVSNLPRLQRDAIFGLPLTVKKEERELLSTLAPQLTSRDVILVNGIHFYWTRYLLKNANTIWGEYYITCGNEGFTPYYDENNVLTARIFSGSLSAEEAKESILSIKKSQNFERIFLIASLKDECGNGEHFANWGFLEKVEERLDYKVYKFIEDEKT